MLFIISTPSGAQRSGRCTPKFTHIMSGSQVASLFTQFTPSDLRATNHSHYHDRGLLHAGRAHSATSKMLSQNFLLARSDWQVNYGNPRNLFHDAPANLRCKFVLDAADRWIKSVGPIYETIPTRSLKRQSKLQITFPSRSVARCCVGRISQSN
jgi:hypothetical protein